MRILLIGPGALGCLLAVSLGQQGNDHDIRLLDHNPARVALLSARGLILEKDSTRLSCHVPVSIDPPEVGKADVILLCVKSGDVRGALDLAGKAVAPEGIVVALQNGIGHLPLLEEFPGSVALGVTSLGANLVGPGHVRYAGRGLTRMGFVKTVPEGATQLVSELAELLCRADIETEVVDRILEHVWSKLYINVGINALTAILNCPNGELLSSDWAMEKLGLAVREAEAVARASHIPVRRDPVEITLEVCRATRNNISSMLQDVRNRKPTEIEAINGAVVREGHRLHVPVPVNEELVRSVKTIEQQNAT